ncbi:hypothetical protein MAM1_0128d06050 [Mucor ambiguus]|uniref:Uncharacterized protein n=1 Tax=Mucor ambiguus TaxID=91626 RepID=A0A0C9LVD1_9FUNG|nr:hypothetical protein MAM1_0128d06050 [Mucor ambiguus]
MKTHILFFLSCIALVLLTLLTEATSNKDSTIIAIGVDLSHTLETKQSTVRVAASLINESTSLADVIVAVSNLRTAALPDIDNCDYRKSSHQNQWHLFQEVYQYDSAQCTNQTTGFLLNNNDTFALEENLTYLLKRIKYATSVNFRYSKVDISSGKYFAVLVESKYDQEFRSLAKAAAKRAGFAGALVMGRNVASTMICPDNKIERKSVYLEFHLEEYSLDIAIVLKDEDGIFEILANERLNYTTSVSDAIPILSSTLDRLLQNAEIPDDTIINQVVITSANPLTLSHHRAVQHLQTSLKGHLENDNLVFCGAPAADDDNDIRYEHRIAFGAAKYSRLIAQEQLEDDHMLCCVELSPLHYGIAMAGGLMHPIIRRHSIEDGPKSAVFTTILPQQQQESIEIAVYRGMRLQSAFNAHVGSLHIQNDGFLSQLNITIEVNYHNEELILIVQDLTTGQATTATFINNLQTVATEVEQSERIWDLEQFDLNQTLDQQLKDNVNLVVSRYASTAIDTLQERLSKKLRYMFLPRWKRQQMNDLLSQSESRLIQTAEKTGHSSTFT